MKFKIFSSILFLFFIFDLQTKQLKNSNDKIKDSKHKKNNQIKTVINKKKSNVIKNKLVDTNQYKIKQLTTKLKNKNSIKLEDIDSLIIKKPIIEVIEIVGNNSIEDSFIKNKIPIVVGDYFNPILSATIIKNIYSLGYFKQVVVFIEELENNKVKLIILVEEKPKVKNIIFKGNKNFSEKELRKKLKTDSIKSILPEELDCIINKIKTIYKKKNFHSPDITIEIDKLNKDELDLIINIKENKQSYVQKIKFEGNNLISSKKIKKFIFTKENWIGSFLNNAGAYRKEMLEADKAYIEDLYKSNGFIKAKVYETILKLLENNNFEIIYKIDEGAQYVIEKIEFPDPKIFSENTFKALIPTQENSIFSSELLRKSIEALKMILGDNGYIFASVEPVVDVDELKKTIKIKFYFDCGAKIHVNKVSIRGNNKTKDKVLRRQLLLRDGDLVTNRLMELSKNKVALLNYSEPNDGINWKITKLDNENVDLDLIIKEAKTGKFNLSAGYGGSATSSSSPQTGLSLTVDYNERNLFGSGISFITNCSFAKKNQSFFSSISDSWLFDKPVRGEISVYKKVSEYEDIKITESAPVESLLGGVCAFGKMVRFFDFNILCDLQLGIESTSFNSLKPSLRYTDQERAMMNIMLSKNFQSGNQSWVTLSLAEDARNNAFLPTDGYKWNWYSQLAFPFNSSSFSYFKTEFDATYYSALIAPHSLILSLHAHAGFIHPFSGYNAPWRSLFHIGGPTSIRGYLYGQVGPTWFGDSLGASKAFYVNSEFIIPLTKDLNTKLVLFYDGGAGWDVPYKKELDAQILNFNQTLTNNNFFYRHSVGIGIKLKTPTNMQVDFGIKLNPSKAFKNNQTELHLSMEHNF